MRQAVLFDLDGTITDPGLGFARCLQHALDAMGLDPVPTERLRRLIGPPFQSSLPTIGVPSERIDEAISLYRAEYEKGGLFEAALYDGIVASIESLAGAGFRIALATSKPTGPAERILRHFGVHGHFAFVGGATPDGSRVHKHDVIAHVLEELGPSVAVMVGDRRYDVEGARRCGLPSIAVHWGYADPGELDACGPDARVDHPSEIADAVAQLVR